jgi:hypothetical protein
MLLQIPNMVKNKLQKGSGKSLVAHNIGYLLNIIRGLDSHT